jgi:hypothetical protein
VYRESCSLECDATGAQLGFVEKGVIIMLSSFPSVQGRVAGRHLDPIMSNESQHWSLESDPLGLTTNAHSETTLSFDVHPKVPAERNSEAAMA